MSALRLSLPYHDARMPPDLTAPTTSSSSNVARTLQVCRQAVLDARRARGWLARRVRADRHPRHEPGVVPGDADGRARAADPRRGAEPRLAATSPTSSGKGCPPRTCGPASTATSTSSGCARCGCRSARRRTSRACGTRGCCSSTRATTSRSPCTSRATWCASSSGWRCRTSWRCCRAATTRTGVAPFKYIDGYVLTKFLVGTCSGVAVDRQQPLPGYRYLSSPLSAS